MEILKICQEEQLPCAKAFNIPKNRKYDGYQRGLASMVYKSFDKNYSDAVKSEIMSNQQLAEELQKTIKKTEKQKLH